MSAERLLSLLCACLVTAGAVAASELPQNFRLEPVLGGLTEPSALAALPDGSLLVAERTTGDVRQVRYGELRAAPVCSVAVDATAAGGLLGIAVHPDFSRTRWRSTSERSPRIPW